MNGVIAALLLASVRLWALLRVQPGWAVVLGRTWGWIAAGVAVLLAGLASISGRLPMLGFADPAELGVALAFELMLGSVVGLAAALPGWALVGAAAESERALELRGPTTFVPLLVAASLAGALSLGLHRPLIAGMLGSFEQWALADPSTWVPGAELGTWLCRRIIEATALGLALATPVLLSRTVIELGVSSLARTGFEAANLTSVITPGLRLAAGLLALGAAWSAYPEAFARGL